MPFINTKNISMVYNGQSILSDVSLDIERGEIFALIGPTGAGKTTLLRILDLLETPSTGRIYFDDIDVTRSPQHRLRARRRMSFVQQKPIAFSMNVFDNVACGLKWRHEKSYVITQKVDEALKLVGMADYKTRDAKTLSGGETQRVAIARALVTEPEVLFLDEPTANLDPISTAKVEEALAHIIQERKTTMIMATHDMSQGQRLADNVGVLINGSLQQVSTPLDIFCCPQSKDVAEFVGVENIMAGVIVSKDDDLAMVEIKGQRIQAVSDYAIGDDIYALIRPEDVTFTLSKDSSSARNVFQGEITRMLPIGPLVRIEINCGFPLLAVVTKTSVAELGLDTGSVVYASFKATAVHTIKRWN
jgi:tungstate transport system ATP-binding protein